jgi:hypothetical protein
MAVQICSKNQQLEPLGLCRLRSHPYKQRIKRPYLVCFLKLWITGAPIVRLGTKCLHLQIDRKVKIKYLKDRFGSDYRFFFQIQLRVCPSKSISYKDDPAFSDIKIA